MTDVSTKELFNLTIAMGEGSFDGNLKVTLSMTASGVVTTVMGMEFNSFPTGASILVNGAMTPWKVMVSWSARINRSTKERSSQARSTDAVFTNGRTARNTRECLWMDSNKAAVPSRFQTVVVIVENSWKTKCMVSLPAMDVVVNGLMHFAQPLSEPGSGTKSWPSGEQYVGQWRDNKCHGTGTRSWPDGSFYCGEWKAGKYHGNGTYFWPSGNAYEGEWVCGLKEGRGTFTWQNDGKRYEGEYKNGKKCGFGTFTWPDGSEYKGEWSNNQRHGTGQHIDAYGIVAHSGLWRANKPCSLTTREMGSC